MDKSKESELKTLIVLANKELEAHNFKKSKRICNKALQINSENPNIYLILFLAQYKVSEIEDLQKCEIDYESDLYKTLRKYAGKKLNDELNKYLSDKHYNSFFSSISSRCIEFFKEFLGIELLLSPNNKTLSKNHEKIQGLFFAFFFFVLIGSFICCAGTLSSENNYIDTACSYIVIISFWVMFFKLINREPKVEDELNYMHKFIFLMKTFKQFILFSLFLIAIYYLFYLSIQDFSEKKFLLALVKGIVPTFILPYTYKKFYNLISNLTELFYTLSPETRKFLIRFFSKS